MSDIGLLERKLFLGVRLKRLRRELGLTQTRMAEDLGVSPSYLNLLERNQRPVTAQVLLRLAEVYDLDMKALSATADTSDVSDLGEVFADPLFADLSVPRHEISEIASNAPGVAAAMLRLYQSYLARKRLAELGVFDRNDGAPETAQASTPSDWVRDYIQGEKNYFAELEESAEQLAATLNAEPHAFAATAGQWLGARGTAIKVVPVDVLGGYVRRFDRHRKRLMLSETLSEAGRAFAIAYQVALSEHQELIARMVTRAAPPDPPTRTLLTVSLANYLAAALLMPYASFQELAEQTQVDVDALCARFGVSHEQACHRLTTLARPGARGIPFFMLRVDSAGNISKRFAGAAFPFSRFGGTCPRWNIHASFKTPGRTVTQIVETPDGARYFTFARTVQRIGALHSSDDAELAIGMGCEMKYAPRLAYARGLDLSAPIVTPIGPACRICERQACAQRAAEPIARTLVIDDFAKSVAPYPFVM
jgi:predicted transcriptional regulator/transcriptional regulator with XRE-family HTH domain